MFAHHSRRPKILELRGQTEKVLAPAELGAELRNFIRTDEGTLRSVVGPLLYHPPKLAAEDPFATGITGDIEGIFHHVLESGREILLVHAGQSIYEYQGWLGNTLAWKLLIDGSPGLSTERFLFPLRKGHGSDILTQFVGTPSGVVIIPQDDDGYGRALFYDGDIVAPLGFSEAPGAPQGESPAMSPSPEAAIFADSGNYRGYHFSASYALDTNAPDGTLAFPPVYGPHRMGTTKPHATNSLGGAAKSNPHGGELSQGEWRCRAQYQDIWGNRSPLSPPSNGVLCFQAENVSDGRRIESLRRGVERLKIQVAWNMPEGGPDGMPLEGTNLYRTQDLVSSGDPSYYHLIDYASAGPLAVVTLPGSTCTFYPDNIPDAWLTAKAVEVDPMPEFKVACWALGRLWIGNVKGDPGRIQPSFPGLPGTMQALAGVYPDTASEVTALHPVPMGFLAFTRNSTFMVRPNDAGDSVTQLSISSVVGCVSPDTVKALPNGATIWLGEDGFYGWAPGDTAPTPLFDDLRRTASRINSHWSTRACAVVDIRSGEYRCWVPLDGAKKNNECCVFNGSSWSFRDDVLADAACSSRDRHRYCLVAGRSSVRIDGAAAAEYQGIYAMDHDAQRVYASDSENRESVIETSWLRVPTSDTKAGVARILVLLRETQRADFKVEVMRDWRERVVQTNAVGDGTAPKLYPTDDEPAFWGLAEIDGTTERRVLQDTKSNPLGEDDVRWDVRRPFWQKIDVYVPDCECFKLRFTFTGDAEFVGLKYVEQTPGTDIGTSNVPGGAS